MSGIDRFTRRWMGMSNERPNEDRNKVERRQTDYTTRFGLMAADQRVQRKQSVRSAIKGQKLGGG